MAKTETKIIEIKIQGLDGFNEIAKHVEQIEIAEKEIKKLKYETDELGKSVKRSMTTQDKNKVAEYTTTIKMHRREIGVLSREVISSFKADQQKIGHIEKLEAEVQSLTLQYRKLTEAQLNDANVGGKMLVNLKKKREELQGMKQAYGDYGMAVGNYGTATKMLGINIGQVMKEMPNFAISARTGIMSLSNNLPMLGEAIQYVRIEQQKLIAAGKQAPSMFSLISKSVFGLTGILSIGMVLLQLYGTEIIKWVSSLFKAKDATAGLDEANKNLNKTLKDGKSFYTTASTEIATLENNLRLAEKGLIDSEVVLNKYNTALGDSFGKAESLYEALSNITQIKQDYIEGLVAMTAAHDILSIAIDKSADALALERQGKPGFFGYVKQFGSIILDSFDPKNWGLMALPNTLNRIANVGTETYQAFYDNINKLRAESQKGVQAYDDEVSRITQKYKDDPFMLKLLGLDSGKKTTKENSTKVTETMLRQFDYESKIMEERANAMEVGREKELAAIDADYNAKLVKSRQHIDKLKQQEKAGVKGAKEARIQAEKQQEEYELALEEGKARKKIEINLKYDKLQADNAIAELKHQHDMMIAENELSAKEQYDLTVKYAEDEYIAKMAQLDLMNISEEEYIIKSTELWNQRQLAIANGEKKLTNDLHSENLARLNNELAALTTGKDAQFQDIDAVFNKKTETLNAQKAKELEAAGTNAELIKSIEAKYAAESIALEQWKITSKIEKYKFWADTALNVGSEVNKAITAFAEHELSVWAKANEGKANFDIEYEKKKIELQRKEAIREKALAVMNTTINTAAAIVGFLAKPSGLAGAALSVAAGITGAAQIAAILATPLPSMSLSGSGNSPKVERRTVTEKFHSGGTIGTTTGEEKPITALTGESVNTIATTQMFSPILSALNQIGGGKAITSGVNTSMGTDMLAAAFSKALRQMPAPRIIWSDFETASERQRMIENNRLVR